MVIDPKQIQKQAKKIMDEFKTALDKVKEENLEIGFEREEGVREERENKTDSEFKKRRPRSAYSKSDPESCLYPLS